MRGYSQRFKGSILFLCLALGNKTTSFFFGECSGKKIGVHTKKFLSALQKS